ncbi:uncharacterized protein [Rutidosis leptorrhynchoides]|uniref:uncharacterized protein n=1 Tax=Rutidosis leptorrhynchoides TaxID=125765 RepID=UPI003A99E5F0
MCNNVGGFIVIGDFNSVRSQHERFGTRFYQSEADDFEYFINDCITNLFPTLSGIILSNVWSDHCPIILRNERLDYGPTPFKLFHSWFQVEGFEDVVIAAWNEDASSKSNNPQIILKGHVSDIMATERCILIKSLQHIESLEAENQAQKYRKVAQIAGVMSDGTWADLLSSPFSDIEIKDAIWSCGSDRSPNPDGFTFKFVKYFWDTIKDDVFACVRNFHLTSHVTTRLRLSTHDNFFFFKERQKSGQASLRGAQAPERRSLKRVSRSEPEPANRYLI